MKKPVLLTACLITGFGLLTGCASDKFLEEPFSPIAEPARPLVTPINDTAEGAVSVKKIKPFGLDTTVSIADQRQIRVSF